MYLNMGPSHPSTHGVIKIALELDAETVVNSEVEIGYLHRAFEKMAENRTYTQVVPYTDRLNYVSPLINNVGYIMAVEKLMGIETTPRCQYIRVIMCEISRIADHFTSIGAQAMELGAFTVFLYLMKAREYLYELIEDTTGARVTTTYTRVGGLSQDLPRGFEEKTRIAIKKSRDVLKEVDGLLTKNRIFVDRTKGIGKISQKDAVSYGITGPLLRATGIPYDIRKNTPYLVYDRLKFDIPTDNGCDVFGRYLVRMAEMEQSLRIIEQCLADLPDGPVNVADHRVTLPPKEAVYTNIEALMNHFKFWMPGHGIRPPQGEVYFAVEGGNGELGFYVVSDGSNVPYRVRVRPPCLAPMAALPLMINGYTVADIISTFGSINMIAGELDR